MSFLSISIEEITKTDFRNYLLLRKDEIKWFSWHLGTHMKDFTAFNYCYKDKLVGIFCLKIEGKTLADIYIDKNYRRMGLGELLVKKLNSKYPDLMFKVNPCNRNSIKFFETILSKGIISRKDVNEDVYTYYS